MKKSLIPAYAAGFLFVQTVLVCTAQDSKSDDAIPLAAKNEAFAYSTPAIKCLTSDRAENKAIQGTWMPVKAELGGKPLNEAILKIISLKLTDGKYEVLVGDKPDRGTYTLDSTTMPLGMTVTGTEGPNQGKSFPAIYELKGDSLQICYDLSGAKRPEEFKSVAGTKHYLVTYSRKKE